MIAYRMSRPITNQLSVTFRIKEKINLQKTSFLILLDWNWFNSHYHDIKLRKTFVGEYLQTYWFWFCSAHQKGRPEPYNLKLVNTKLSIPMRALGNHGNQSYIVDITKLVGQSWRAI